MTLLRLLVAQGFALIVLFLIASSLSSGLAAGGSGADTISGFSITNVAYGFLDDNPRFIDRVWFTVDDPDSDRQPAMVKIQLTAGSDQWYACDPIGGEIARWACTLSPVAAVASADQLTVVAA